MSKRISTAVAVTLVAGLSLGSAITAEAHGNHRRGHHHHRHGDGDAVAAGAIAGFFAALSTTTVLSDDDDYNVLVASEILGDIAHYDRTGEMAGLLEATMQEAYDLDSMSTEEIDATISQIEAELASQL